MAISTTKSLTKSGGGSVWNAVKNVGSNTKSGGSFFKDLTKSGSSSGLFSSIGSLFGGGGSSSGGSGGNIYGSLLGGLSGAADALISKEAVEEQGKQSRKTLDFQAALEDYYSQKNKVRKRAALDTYGQFSTMDRWAPGAQAAPSLDQPNKPGY